MKACYWDNSLLKRREGAGLSRKRSSMAMLGVLKL